MTIEQRVSIVKTPVGGDLYSMTRRGYLWSVQLIVAASAASALLARPFSDLESNDSRNRSPSSPGFIYRWSQLPERPESAIRRVWDWEQGLKSGPAARKRSSRSEIIKINASSRVRGISAHHPALTFLFSVTRTRHESMPLKYAARTKGAPRIQMCQSNDDSKSAVFIPALGTGGQGAE